MERPNNKDALVFAHIDATLLEYDKHRVALDHQLAVEGLAIEVKRRRVDQNGFDGTIPADAA